MSSEVFISYRRGLGSGIASYFETYLNSKGFNCKIDVNNKYSGDFAEFIKREISQCSLMLLVITEGSIDRMVDVNDNSFMEVDYAYKNNIPILPIIVDGVDMFKDVKDNEHSLPESVTHLTKINCRFYKHELRDDTINYIVDYLKELRMKRITSRSIKPMEFKSIDLSKLEPFTKMAKELQVKVNGVDYLYTGKLIFGNRPSGECKMVSEEGMVIEADFQPTQLYTGSARFFTRGELVYEGKVVELKYEGTGKLYTSEYTHEGQFINGKPKGFGSRIYKDGTSMEGTWTGDSLGADGVSIFPNGRMFSGKIEEGYPEGYGTERIGDTNYTGYYRRGELSNQLIMETPTSTTLGPLNHNGDFHGEVFILTQDGYMFYQGNFNNGVATGEGKYFLSKDNIANFIEHMDSLPEDLILPFFDTYENIVITFEHEEGNILEDKGCKVRSDNSKLILKVSEVDRKGQQDYTFYNEDGSILNTLHL